MYMLSTVEAAAVWTSSFPEEEEAFFFVLPVEASSFLEVPGDAPSGG